MDKQKLIERIKSKDPSVKEESIAAIEIIEGNEPYYLIRFKPIYLENVKFYDSKYILTNKEGDYVGDAKTSIRSWRPKELELSYGIDKSMRGKGLGTKMLGSIVTDIYENHAFDNLEFPENKKSSISNITLEIDQNNIASQRIAEKNGFVANPAGYDLTKENYEELVASQQTSME